MYHGMTTSEAESGEYLQLNERQILLSSTFSYLLRCEGLDPAESLGLELKEALARRQSDI